MPGVQAATVTRTSCADKALYGMERLFGDKAGTASTRGSRAGCGTLETTIPKAEQSLREYELCQIRANP